MVKSLAFSARGHHVREMLTVLLLVGASAADSPRAGPSRIAHRAAEHTSDDLSRNGSNNSMRFLMRLSILALWAPVAVSHGQTAIPQPTFGPLERLVGTWAADSGSGGQPGVAVQGGETWTRDLAGRVLQRRDYSEYRATSTRPAFRHDGLMLIGPAPGGGFLAHSYDNEGHVIDYSIVAADSAIVFTSRPAPATPQFRLTYRVTGDRCIVQFEIAPPDQPGVFRSYVTGAMHRVK
jgi:hypothetical protein